MRKLTALLLALVCLLTSFSVSAAGNVNVDSVIASGYIQSGKIGNIFSITDTVIKFTQEYENISNSTANIVAEYKVLDENNNTIKEYSGLKLEIPAGEKATFEFAVENPDKYGVYTLEVPILVSVNGTTYAKTYKEGFSVCIDLTGENADPNFGFAQQIVNRDFGDVDVTPTLMRNAGATWYREECMSWSKVEKDSRGVYTIPEGTIEKLQKIKDSGLKIVCILNGTNPLYNFPKSDEAINAFVKYCEYVAKQFDGIVDHYEIWNEWNVKQETDTEGYYNKTDVYAKVLAKAYTAVKNVNPNNTIIGCVTGSIDYAWIDRVLESLDGTKAMDAISVHSYPWKKDDGVDEAQLIDDTARLREVMEKHSVDVPIWLSEIGFSTFDGETTWLAPCTNEQQLNSLVLVNAINKGYSLFDKLIQYSFHDRADFSAIQSNWGLVNCWQRGFTDKPEAELTPYGAKPAYLGIAAMNYFTGGNTVFEGMEKAEQDEVYMLKFRNNNLRSNVMLCINGDIDSSVEKSIVLDTNELKVYDKYGNCVNKMVSDTGEFALDISAEPMYLTWPVEGGSEFLNVSVNENTKKVIISGVAEAPGDLVTVMVVSKGEELSSYDPERTLFVGQATADAYGEYQMSFIMPEILGQFEVYANSTMRREKKKNDLVLSYSVPEIKVMQSGVDVYAMSELNASNPVELELRGFVDLADEEPVLIIAQYKEGQLVSAQLDDKAIGDCTEVGNEIKKSFSVQNGVDKIKIMYMNINNMKPFVAAYEIK